jgi:hypothetical protein
MSDRLVALAERVEAAEGVDRELDRDIMLEAVPCDRAPFRYWTPMNENTGHGAVDIERVYYGPHCAQAVAVPAFTASIDAAMTLVPFGCHPVTIEIHSDGTCEADCWTFSEDGRDNHIQVAAYSPALALCAAALRARATLPPEPMMRPMASPYLYITDETGAEVPGSRRDVTGLTTGERITIHRALEQQAAEGCMVRHSEEVR